MPDLLFCSDAKSPAKLWSLLIGYFERRNYNCYVLELNHVPMRARPCSAEGTVAKQTQQPELITPAIQQSNWLSSAIEPGPSVWIASALTARQSAVPMLEAYPPAGIALLKPPVYSWPRLLRLSATIPLWIGLPDSQINRQIEKVISVPGMQVHVFMGMKSPLSVQKGWERVASTLRGWLENLEIVG